MNYVYLHGFCSGPKSEKARRFRDWFAGHGVDLPVPDLNGADFSRLTLSGQIRQVAGVIAGSRGPVTLIGSSMGGYVATLLAQEELRVERLVLLAPAFQFVTRRIGEIGDGGVAEWRRTGYRDFHHFEYGEPRPLNVAILDDAALHDARPLARALPTLIVHGLRDDTVPWQISEEYLARHPEAELLLFDSDHMLNDVLDRIWPHVRAFCGL